MRFVRVDISVQAGVDEPLDEVEGLVETGRQFVADRVVEVVSQHEVVAVDVFFGREAEGERVEVGGVRGVGEVGGGFGGARWEAAVVLDAGCEVRGGLWGVYARALLAVDGDGGLVGVVGSRGYAEDVFVRHGDGFMVWCWLRTGGFEVFGFVQC